MLFVDTSLIICSVTKFENLYEKAKLLLKSSWMTTKDVLEEVTEVKKRRNHIYKNVIGISSTISRKKDLTVEDIYSSCFKSSLTGPDLNDERHLEKLFQFCISKSELRKKKKLTEDAYKKFLETLYPVIRDIKVEIGIILNKMNDKDFYSKCIIDYPKTDKHYKKLRKNLKKNIKIETRSQKMDINIITTVICYAYRKKMDIKFVACDFFFVKQSQKIIQRTNAFFSAKFSPKMEIKHLNEI